MHIKKHIKDARDKTRKNATSPIRMDARKASGVIVTDRAITVVTIRPIPPVRSAFLLLQKHLLLIHTGVKSPVKKAVISVNTPTPNATHKAIVRFVIMPKKDKKAAAIPIKIPAITPMPRQPIQISALSLPSQQ